MDKVKTDNQPQNVRKGPVEGVVIVDGQPQTEQADMPTISFTKEAIERLQEQRQK